MARPKPRDGAAGRYGLQEPAPTVRGEFGRTAATSAESVGGEATENGLVSPALEVDRTAAALLAGIQGGVAIMMSTGDSAHLKAALDNGIDHLRSTPAPRV